MRFQAILLLCPIFFACSSKSPSSGQKIPVEVLSAFKTDFSNVTNLYWEQEEGDFEAQFLQEGKEMSAIYDKSGTLWEIEETIDISELPSPAVKHIQQKMPGSVIAEASKITLRPDKTLYEAEVNGKDLLFDEAGTFLKTGRN